MTKFLRKFIVPSALVFCAAVCMYVPGWAASGGEGQGSGQSYIVAEGTGSAEGGAAGYGNGTAVADDAAGVEVIPSIPDATPIMIDRIAEALSSSGAGVDMVIMGDVVFHGDAVGDAAATGISAQAPVSPLVIYAGVPPAVYAANQNDATSSGWSHANTTGSTTGWSTVEGGASGTGNGSATSLGDMETFVLVLGDDGEYVPYANSQVAANGGGEVFLQGTTDGGWFYGANDAGGNGYAEGYSSNENADGNYATVWNHAFGTGHVSGTIHGDLIGTGILNGSASGVGYGSSTAAGESTGTGVASGTGGTAADMGAIGGTSSSFVESSAIGSGAVGFNGSISGDSSMYGSGASQGVGASGSYGIAQGGNTIQYETTTSSGAGGFGSGEGALTGYTSGKGTLEGYVTAGGQGEGSGYAAGSAVDSGDMVTTGLAESSANGGSSTGLLGGLEGDGTFSGAASGAGMGAAGSGIQSEAAVFVPIDPVHTTDTQGSGYSASHANGHFTSADPANPATGHVGAETVGHGFGTANAVNSATNSTASGGGSATVTLSLSGGGSASSNAASAGSGSASAHGQ